MMSRSYTIAEGASHEEDERRAGPSVRLSAKLQRFSVERSGKKFLTTDS